MLTSSLLPWASSPLGMPALPTIPYIHVMLHLLKASLAVLCVYVSLEMVHKTPYTVFAQEGVKDMHAPERNGQLDEALARLHAFVTCYPQEGTEKDVHILTPDRMGQLDKALTCLRAFIACYPPYGVHAQQCGRS